MAGVFDQIVGRQQADEVSEEQSPPEGKDSSHSMAEEGLAGTDGENSARTDVKLREVAQELLRMGLLEESLRPHLYRTALASMERLNATLEPLDLIARADEIRGLVFLAVRHEDGDVFQDEWSHPLVRKQRLNMEQTLLVAILRQHFIAYEQDAGTGAGDAMVAVDELIPHMQVYLGDRKSVV